jgi:hypothetical protein
VLAVDVNAFNRAYGNYSYAAWFVAALDYNDDGRNTGIDVNAFNRAFNTRFIGFTPTIWVTDSACVAMRTLISHGFMLFTRASRHTILVVRAQEKRIN